MKIYTYERGTILSKNIMVVGDDHDGVFNLWELFERAGFQVTIADNGRNCLVELEKGFQGITILDLMMPIMDRIKIIKKNDSQ